jgi:hypothetical protein
MQNLRTFGTFDTAAPRAVALALGLGWLAGCTVMGPGPERDAGPSPDTGPIADTGRSDAPDAPRCAVACGGVCCADEEECVAGRCLPGCGETNRCGADGACCAAGELCVNEACTAPGAECVDDLDCASGEYCDLGLRRCLPQPTGGLECEVRPPENVFEVELEWQWTEGDTTVAPLVARLSDDNADGTIDEEDAADVLAVAWFSNERWNPLGETSARLVALDGLDGGELWRSPAGIEVCVTSTPAIADLDGDGTVEVVALVASESSPTGPGARPPNCGSWFNVTYQPVAIAIFSHEGTLEALSDPSEVPITGHQAPAIAVADVDRDGLGEIVVQGAVLDHEARLQARVPGSASAGTEYGWFEWPGSDMPILTSVDADPDLEIVTFHGVYDPDGTALWSRPFGLVSEVVGTLVGTVVRTPGAPAAQLVVTYGSRIQVLDAATGETLVSRMYEIPGVTPLFPDVDRDGLPDVCNACTLFGPTYDGDLSETPDCEECAFWEAGSGGYAGQPVLADFDNDGQQEIGFAVSPNGSRSFYVVMDLATGAPVVRWSARIPDGSYASVSSTVFDFDGNGSAEVLFQDECHVRILSGRTGETLWSAANTSITASEYPLVADVDGNGRANLVVGSNDTTSDICDAACITAGCAARGLPFDGVTRGVRVYRDVLDRWIDARSVWNQHTYFIDSVEEDGSLPAAPRSPWERYNTFRLNRYPNPDTVFHAPDLLIESVRVSDALCTGLRPIDVRIVNRGHRTVPAGVRAVLFADRGAGLEQVLAVTTDAPIGPGSGIWVSFDLDSRPFPVADDGTATIHVEIDTIEGEPGGSVAECDEENNTTEFPIDCGLF